MAEALHHGVGKRKTSVARIWMRPGAGNITINKKPMAEYLVRESDRMLVRQPLEITETLDKYDIQINVRGGGLSGQAGAIRHGITRTLMDINPDFRLPLKQNDLLTRDSRMKERKKYGQPGARKRFQYSKR
jgi:small subunit ribosomal protein S9